MKYHPCAPAITELDAFVYFMCHFHWLLKGKRGKKGWRKEAETEISLKETIIFLSALELQTNNDTRKHSSIEATKALLFSPHGMSTTTVRGLCLCTLQRSAWMATGQIEPHLTCCPQALYSKQGNSPLRVTECGFGSSPSAFLASSWSSVINWADNLSNENSINSNRPRWGKLYTVERGEKNTHAGIIIPHLSYPTWKN